MTDSGDFIEKLDMVMDDIKAMDSDDILDILEKIQPYNAKLIVETTHRTNNRIFSDEQIQRMTVILGNSAAFIYDELNITKEQARKGNEIVEKTIFDENR